MGRGTVVVAALGAFLFNLSSAEAHFYLQQPPANLQQDANGNPQKTAPCGGAGTPTNVITPFQAGTTITIMVSETIFHPGHYRVVLAENDMSELPPDPVVTPVGTDPCGSVEIQDPPVYPVLADVMLEHTSAFVGPQTFEVTLPDNITCDHCVLQVIEYMSNHAAPCFYHHCADISIQTEPVMTTSASSSAATSGSGANGSGGSGATSGAGGSGAGLNILGDNEDEGGCSCSVVGDSDDTLGSFALLAFVGLGAVAGARRRRR